MPPIGAPRHPEDRIRLPKAEVLFEPLPNNPLRLGLAHDLEELLEEVMQEAPRLLHEEVQFDCEIRWTNRDIRNYFAMARWNTAQPPCSGSVDVNRILNSPDISGATLKFLIWHELVHLYLQAGHTSRFRELERLWDGYIEADRELDTLNERFGVFHY